MFLVVAGCAGDAEPLAVVETTTTSTSTSTSTTSSAPLPTTTVVLPSPAVVVVGYTVERRTADAPTADFAAVVEATLEDGRGWQRAGFDLVRVDDAAFRIILAEGDAVDALCLP